MMNESGDDSILDREEIGVQCIVDSKSSF